MSHIIKEYNCETGETIEREMTVDEIERNDKVQEAEEQRRLAENEKKAAKADVLQRLGITADEAKLLLS